MGRHKVLEGYSYRILRKVKGIEWPLPFWVWIIDLERYKVTKILWKYAMKVNLPIGRTSSQTKFATCYKDVVH